MKNIKEHEIVGRYGEAAHRLSNTLSHNTLKSEGNLPEETWMFHRLDHLGLSRTFIGIECQASISSIALTLFKLPKLK